MFQNRMKNWLIKRNDASLVLNRILNDVTTPKSRSQDFALSRIELYQDLQSLLVNNNASTIKSGGLHSIFYARYHSVRELCESDAPKLSDQFKLVNKDKDFENICEKNIEKTVFSDGDALRTRDTFKECLVQYFDGNEELVDEILAFETKKHIEILNNKRLKLIFNRANLWTLESVQNSVTKDIILNPPAIERFGTFAKEHPVLMGVFVFHPVTWFFNGVASLCGNGLALLQEYIF